MPDRFDVIVVGAGTGGCATALYLARKGYDVLLLEKGKIPGHRNMTGGVLFGKFRNYHDITHLVPDFESEAPLERKIAEHSVYVVSNPTNGTRSYKVFAITKASMLGKLGVIFANPNTGFDYSVLRSKFDKWFANKVVQAGGMLSTEVTAEDLLWKDGKVTGVLTSNEELLADLVVDASGVTSTLVERAGLRTMLRPDQVYHGIKHVYKLDQGTMEERFDLNGNEGKALLFFGEFMKGVSGGAFLYTNRESLSLGIVVSLDSVIENAVKRPDVLGKPLDILEEFEAHPMISQYLEGATLVEYSAHNIPKGSKAVLKRPFTSGFLVVGDAMGAFTKMGPMIDGMRRAIATGIMAGETFEIARKAGDFSARTLEIYSYLLRPIYFDIWKYRLDSLVTETRLAYNTFPKVLFALNLFVSNTQVKRQVKLPDNRDAIQRIQERTGILEYDEDKTYSHIHVNHEMAATSETKGWIPGCPYNCFTLVLEKGVFASFKDLYNFNLQQLSSAAKAKGQLRKSALERTRDDVKRGSVRFDHVACVGCGTCGLIGPKDQVLFGHERNGHGVKYVYG